METHFEAKLDLVIDLLNDNNINIHKLLDSYQDTQLLRRILELDTTWTDEDQALLAKKLAGNEHHKDERDLKTFAQSLVINWLVEDLVFMVLSKNGFNVTKEGGDQNRELLQGNQVSPKPDLKIDDKQPLWIEVIASFPYKGGNCFWEDKGYFDLRDNKLNHLKTMAKKDTTIVLGVAVADKKYFTLRIHDQLDEQKPSKESNFGNKNTTKIHFQNKKPTFSKFENLPFTIKNVVREKVYKPLDPKNKMYSFMEQYFEMQRGNCVVIPNTDQNILHTNLKVLTNEAQLYYIYYQESEDNNLIKISQDHVINNYDFGFQYSFNNPEILYWWQGSVLKHHILFNLKKHKVWEQYIDRKTDMLHLPRSYFPELNEIKIDKKFLKFL